VTVPACSGCQQFFFRPDGTQLGIYAGGLVKETIPLPGGETAVYNGSGLNFIRHTDYLGSSRLATTVIESIDELIPIKHTDGDSLCSIVSF
jgi:hypothetical protein